jgi:hypothetical protein
MTTLWHRRVDAGVTEDNEGTTTGVDAGVTEDPVLVDPDDENPDDEDPALEHCKHPALCKRFVYDRIREEEYFELVFGKLCAILAIKRGMTLYYEHDYIRFLLSSEAF